MKIRVIVTFALFSAGFALLQPILADPVSDLSAKKIKFQAALGDIRAQMTAARATNSLPQFKSALDSLRGKINEAASDRALLEAEKNDLFDMVNANNGSIMQVLRLEGDTSGLSESAAYDDAIKFLDDVVLSEGAVLGSFRKTAQDLKVPIVKARNQGK